MTPLFQIGGRRAKCLIVTVVIMSVAAQAQYRSGPAADSPYSGAGAKAPAAHDSLDPATVALGRKLFFDTSLSVDGWLSCASCHDPAHGFSDSRRLSVGVQAQRSKRHAPTLLGRGRMEAQFWDGRAATLEEQVLQPILNPEEMGMTMDAVLRHL